MKLLPKFIRTWLLQRAFAQHNAAFAELRLARERDALSVGGPWGERAYKALREAQSQHRKAVALVTKRMNQLGIS